MRLNATSGNGDTSLIEISVAQCSHTNSRSSV